MRVRMMCCAVLLLSIAACDEPLRPGRQPDPAFAFSVLGSATGGGIIDLTTAGAGLDHFSFSAIQKGDGSASGNFHQYRSVGGLAIEFTGEVTCVTFDPVNHRAWIGGVIKDNRSTHPAFQVDTLHAPGLDVWFRVVDYGEGSNAQPDRSTTYGFKGSAGFVTSAEYCAGQPWPADDARTFPITKGNLQIRP